MQSQRCSRNFQPNVFLLHVEIGNYRVKDVSVLQQLERSGATIRGAHGIPFPLKNHLQRESHIGFIIDDEERRLTSHRGKSLQRIVKANCTPVSCRKGNDLSLPGSLQSMSSGSAVAGNQQSDDFADLLHFKRLKATVIHAQGQSSTQTLNVRI